MTNDAGAALFDESPGGISPPGAPRTVHEPLDSHGWRHPSLRSALLSLRPRALGAKHPLFCKSPRGLIENIEARETTASGEEER
jgi:hypothetical protein